MATLILVCGASRSGTTMLDLMLGNAPDAFSCGEVYALFRPWREHHFRIECRCGQPMCSIWEKVSNVPERQFHTNALAELGVNYVVDSSKDLCWMIDAQRWATANGIAAIILLLWKDPINLAYSYWKRGAGIDGWYKGFVSYYRRFFDSGVPYRSVCLDDLTSHPQSKLARICAVVGMPYFEGKERFWEKQHHHLLGSHGVYKQAADKKSAIRASEDFPPEFETQVAALSKNTAQDALLQEILATLQTAEVSNGSLNDPNWSFLPPKPYPSWYYVMKARQRVQRHFPKASPF